MTAAGEEEVCCMVRKTAPLYLRNWRVGSWTKRRATTPTRKLVFVYTYCAHFLKLLSELMVASEYTLATSRQSGMLTNGSITPGFHLISLSASHYSPNPFPLLCFMPIPITQMACDRMRSLIFDLLVQCHRCNMKETLIHYWSIPSSFFMWGRPPVGNQKEMENKI